MFIIHLFFVFLLIMAVLALAGGMLLRHAIQRIFGRPNGSASNAYQQQGEGRTYTRQADEKPKIIKKNEGEYVDYEEVD